MEDRRFIHEAVQDIKAALPSYAHSLKRRFTLPRSMEDEVFNLGTVVEAPRLSAKRAKRNYPALEDDNHLDWDME